MLTFTESDQRQIDAKGITREVIEQQLQAFHKGIPYTILDRPCTIGDGIMTLTSADLDRYVVIFQEAMDAGRVTKFVPASGAATRMFKTLLAALEHLPQSDSHTTFQELLSQCQGPSLLERFFQRLSSFAFYEALQSHLNTISSDEGKHHWKTVLESLLLSPGLEYAHLPKGLLQFHRYHDHVRTPVEEHIMEGVAYARDSTSLVRLHFTVSPEHEKLIYQHLEQIQDRMTNKGLQLKITFSHQQPSTDTLAVDSDNCPFRDSNGTLVFRPGGHGALLLNLHELQGDIVFIKNIDNVLPERLAEQANVYKKALGGYLVAIQRQLFAYMDTLTQKTVQCDQLRAIFDFAECVLGISVPENILASSEQVQRQFLCDHLNRPLRVCGMVPNTSEPGGGPFWVQHQDGTRSRQIVESSQVDPDSKSQQDLLKTSTHFNPVDLVCGVKDFQGHPFFLPDFADPNTGFISRKSYQGRDLKALELPGLWNGAMAHWNTVFVEVPGTTFNPVKTVFDLLRPEHQPA